MPYRFSLCILLVSYSCLLIGCNRSRQVSYEAPVKSNAKTSSSPIEQKTSASLVKHGFNLTSAAHVPQIQKSDFLLQAPPNVNRWEPSGVALHHDRLWVASDKYGWIASYSFPLKKGINHPNFAHQIQSPLLSRIKWEGLEMDSKGNLLLLEAISRSVWTCESPEKKCKTFTKTSLDSFNAWLNNQVPIDFKYIMFEALTYLPRGIWLGVRGFYNAKKGLVPWAWLAGQDHHISFHLPQGLIDQEKHYGLSGSTYDQKNKGLWLTWSYEDEDSTLQKGVSGLLTYMPLRPFSDQAQTESMTLCARFSLKPEGVTLAQDQVIVIFDNDQDRKGDQPGQIPITSNQDYVWMTPSQSCFSKTK